MSNRQMEQSQPTYQLQAKQTEMTQLNYSSINTIERNRKPQQILQCILK